MRPRKCPSPGCVPPSAGATAGRSLSYSRRNVRQLERLQVMSKQKLGRSVTMPPPSAGPGTSLASVSCRASIWGGTPPKTDSSARFFAVWIARKFVVKAELPAPYRRPGSRVREATRCAHMTVPEANETCTRLLTLQVGCKSPFKPATKRRSSDRLSNLRSRSAQLPQPLATHGTLIEEQTPEREQKRRHL